MKIYKCKPHRESGAYGVTIYPKLSDEDIRIGELDGEIYFSSNAPLEQELTVEEVALTEELREKLVALMPDKNFLRTKLLSIGDMQDMIADCMKLIEFNMLLTARLAGDVWAKNTIEPDKKTLYAARNKAFLDAVDAGEVTLRGDFDDMDVVMARMLSRVSAINETVRDSYVTKLQEAGL